MDLTSNFWTHVGTAVVLGGATAVGEYLTHSVNLNTIITAAEIGYAGSFTYQALMARVETALAGTPGAKPAAAAPTVTNIKTVPSSISYNIGAATIQVTTNSPIGTVEGAYTVGQQYGPLTLPDGANVPAGAFYIGKGEFELNGNYFE
jgi:hypothetical protein